jgi:hypothetical protein
MEEREMDTFLLVQVGVAGFSERGNESAGLIKCRKLLD